MNAAQRTTIEGLIARLEDAKSEIEEMQDEEQGKFDNLSEGLQQSEKGQAIGQAADYLSEAMQSIDDAINGLESAKE